MTLRAYSLCGFAVLTALTLLVIEPARISISGDDAIPLLMPRSVGSVANPLSSSGNWIASSTSTSIAASPMCFTSQGGGATTITYVSAGGAR